MTGTGVRTGRTNIAKPCHSGKAESGYALEMNELSDAKIEEIRSGLLAWFAANRGISPGATPAIPTASSSPRSCSSRRRSTGHPLLRALAELFPTVEALATAPTADVITAWAGLGYNRRAVYLQKTARAVVDEPAAYFPALASKLLRLPGSDPTPPGRSQPSRSSRMSRSWTRTSAGWSTGSVFGSDVPARQATEREILRAAERLVPRGPAGPGTRR